MEKEDGKHGYGTQAVNIGAVFQGHDERGDWEQVRAKISIVNASIYLGCSNIQWLTQEYRKIVQSIELPDRIGNDSGGAEGAHGGKPHLPERAAETDSKHRPGGRCSAGGD